MPRTDAYSHDIDPTVTCPSVEAIIQTWLLQQSPSIQTRPEHTVRKPQDIQQRQERLHQRQERLHQLKEPIIHAHAHAPAPARHDGARSRPLLPHHHTQPQPALPSAPRHGHALAAAHIAFANNTPAAAAEALRRSASQRSAASYTTSATVMTSATIMQEQGGAAMGGLLRRRHSFRRTLRKEEPVVAASKRLSIGRFTGGLSTRVGERREREIVSVVGAGRQSVGVVPVGERRSEAGPTAGSGAGSGPGAAIGVTGTGRSPFAGFGVRKTRSMYGWSGVRDGEARDSSPVGATLKPAAEKAAVFPRVSTRAKEEAETRSGQPAVLDVSTDSAPNPSLPTEPDDSEPIRVRRVRKRPSLLLIATPFKKRGTGVENARIPDVPLAPSAEESGTGSRKVSWASSRRSQGLRDKLRRYFRRASGGSTTTPDTGRDVPKLPPQQVEARRLHFGEGRASAALFAAGLDAETAASTVAAADPTVAFREDTPPTLAGVLLGDRVASPALSEGTARSKSRVTSWADSTIASTAAASTERLSIIAEDELGHGSAPRLFQLRTAPSPKASETTEERQRLSGSATSMGGSFLRRLIRRPTSESNESSQRTEEESAGGEKPVAGNTVYDSLPSQRRRASFVSIASWRNRATVRTVAASNDVPTVEEDKQEAVSTAATVSITGGQAVASSENVNRTDPPSLGRAVRHSGITKYAVAPLSAPVPSAAQLEARGARADNRWQAPLEEKRSLFFPHSPASPSRSAGRKLPLAAAAPDSGALPVTPSRVSGVALGERESMEEDEEGVGGDQRFRRRLEALREPATPRDRPAMSPSVYSRATDDSASVSSAVFGDRKTMDYSPVAAAVTVSPADEVIITSHRRHSAAVPQRKKEQQRQEPASGDWRRWLANEVEHFSAESEALDGLRGNTLSEQREEDAGGKVVATGHCREHAQIEEDADDDAVGFGTVRVGDRAAAGRRQPCAVALRDAALLSGLPVAERKAGGTGRVGGYWEQQHGGRTPGEGKAALHQNREATSATQNQHQQQQQPDHDQRGEARVDDPDGRAAPAPQRREPPSAPAGPASGERRGRGRRHERPVPDAPGRGRRVAPAHRAPPAREAERRRGHGAGCERGGAGGRKGGVSGERRASQH